MDNIFLQPTGWIWTSDWDDCDGANATYVYFRKTFELVNSPTRALIKVSADSRYRLYVNGESVSFGPCKGDDEVWHYEEVDIAQYLKKGNNSLAAIVLRYPALHGKGNNSIWRTDMPGFYLNGNISFEHNQPIYLDADKTWKALKCSDIKIVPESNFLNYLWVLERAQGNPQTSDWMSTEYEDGYWGAAKEYSFLEVKKGISPGNLIKRPIPHMFETHHDFDEVFCIRKSSKSLDEWTSFLKEKREITIPPHMHEIVEISAGELTTGFIQLKVSGGKGCKVKILTAESYGYPMDKEQSTNSQVKKGDRIDCENGQLFGMEDIYSVGGYGTTSKAEIYEPFWFRTFRFIKLEIINEDEALTIQEFAYRETGYPLEVNTHVETSDTSLSAIWDISLRTLRRCMHETYEDCPFYEQLQYAMDTRSQILFTYAVSADDRLARKAIDDFHRSLRYDGLINCCYPSYEPNIIPVFSLYYILMIYDHMMYFGDKKLVERYMPTIDAILGFFGRAIDEKGLVGKIGGPLFESSYWSFVDWTVQWKDRMGVPNATDQGPITMESLLYTTVLSYGSQLAAFIDRNELAELYLERSEKVKDAINKYCRNENGYYQDGPGFDEYSQHCQVWAVLSDTIVGEDAKQLIKRTLQDESLTKCSVAMAYYLFRAVEKVGLYEETKQLWEPWRDMIKQNLTTCVEDPVSARSDCHAWGSLILYELPTVVLGVRPTKPGFEEIEIKPLVGYLDWARGEVITPKGKVTVEWKKVNGEVEMKYQLPQGMKLIDKEVK